MHVQRLSVWAERGDERSEADGPHKIQHGEHDTWLIPTRERVLDQHHAAGALLNGERSEHFGAYDCNPRARQFLLHRHGRKFRRVHQSIARTTAARPGGLSITRLYSHPILPSTGNIDSSEPTMWSRNGRR